MDGMAATVTLSPNLNQRQDRLKALESENFDLKMRLFEAQTRRSPQTPQSETSGPGELSPEEADELRRDLANALIKCQEQALELEEYNTVLSRAKSAIQRLQDESNSVERVQERLASERGDLERATERMRELEKSLAEELELRRTLAEDSEAYRKKACDAEDELRRARGELDVARVEVDASKLKVAQLSEALGTLEREGNEMEAGARGKLQELRNEVVAQKTRADEAETRCRLQVDLLERDRRAAESARRDAQGQHELLSRSLAEKTASERKLQDDVSAAMEKIRALEAKLEEETQLKSQLAEQAEEHLKRRTASEEELRGVQSELDAMRVKAAQLSEAVGALDREGSEMEVGARSRIQDLQASLEAQKGRTDEAERRYRLLEEHMERERLGAEKYQKDIASQNDALRKSLADKEVAERKLLDEVSHLRMKVLTELGTPEDRHRFGSVHQLELQTLRKEVDEKRAALFAAESEKKTIETELKGALSSANMDIQRHMEGRNEREAEAQKMKQRLEIEAERMRDQLQRQKEHVESLERALAETKTEHDHLRAKSNIHQTSAVKAVSSGANTARAALNALTKVADEQPRIMRSLESRCRAVLVASIALKQRMRGDESECSGLPLSTVALSPDAKSFESKSLDTAELQPLAVPSTNLARGMTEALRRCWDSLALATTTANDLENRSISFVNGPISPIPPSTPGLANSFSGGFGLGWAVPLNPSDATVWNYLAGEPITLPPVSLSPDEVEQWLSRWASLVGECLEDAVKQRKGLLDKCQKASESQTDELSREAELMRATCKKLENELEKATADGGKAREQCEDHRREAKRLQQELSSFEHVKASMTSEIERLKRNLENNDRDLEREKKNAATHHTRSRQLEEKYLSASEQLKAKENEARELENHGALLELRDSQAQEKVLELSSEKDGIKNALDDALTDLEEAQGTVTKLKQERSYLLMAVNRLEKLVRHRDEHIKTLLDSASKSDTSGGMETLAEQLQENVPPRSRDKGAELTRISSSRDRFQLVEGTKDEVSEDFANPHWRDYRQSSSALRSRRSNNSAADQRKDSSTPSRKNATLKSPKPGNEHDALSWYLQRRFQRSRASDASPKTSGPQHFESHLKKPTPQRLFRRARDNVDGCESISREVQRNEQG